MAVQRKPMQFGMLHLFENPVHKTEHQIVKEQLDLMQAAEEDECCRAVTPTEYSARRCPGSSGLVKAVRRR